MYKLSRDIFDALCVRVNFDEALCKTIERRQLGFVCKSKEHIDFFGGGLVGMQRVIFSDVDRIKWFEEVVQMDEQTIRDHVAKLPDIQKKHKVSSDVFNLSCVWLIYRVRNSKSISPTLKQKTCVNIALMLLYRFFTSRLRRHFKHLIDEPTALALYNELTTKFDIKRLGSWNQVFLEKATHLVSPESIHDRTFSYMDKDKRVVYALNDTQTRIRAMLKKIYRVFLDVHDRGIKVYAESANVDIDGESMFKDKAESLTQYNRYLTGIIPDKNAFVKIELINIIVDAMPTMSPRMLTEVLEWLSVNFSLDKTGKLDQLMDSILTHAFEVIMDDRSLIAKGVDINKIIWTLRGIYTSSRNTEAILLNNRKECEVLVKKIIKTNNKTALASVRTGFMLYLILRAFTMRHYTS